MKKKYITPRILVEKMDFSLLIQTSKIPIVTDRPGSLDVKAFSVDIWVDDTEMESDDIHFP
jgi:hypothetical protein